MLRAPGGDRKLVGTGWIAVFKKDCNRNVRIFSEELRMQQASWLVICGAGPWLFPGIYPSGIAHVVCPIVFIKTSGHKTDRSAIWNWIA